MNITRRTLLRVSAAATLARMSRVTAALNPSTPNYKAMVCIFLFGGNDSNNLVIPLSAAGYQKYSTARSSSLALPANTLSPIAAADGTPYGLHPRFAPLQPLYLQKKLAVVANVGMLVRPITKQQYQQGQAQVPMNLFSHSDQQQQWQTSSTTLRTGWGGRAADIIAAMNAPSTFPTGVSTSGNSLFLTATTPPATVTNGGLGLDGSDGSPLANARDAAFQQVLTMTSGLTLVQSAGAVVGRGIEVGKVLNQTLQGAGTMTTVFPNTSIGQQLAQVARIMKVRQQLGMNRQIFFASHGGYDTHTNQLPSQDGLFTELAAAMAAFYQATQELTLEDQVTTFTESDFGRTFQPSSGAGSDHAWGSHHMVMGGAVKGGDIYGTFPSLDLGGPDDIGTRGVWLPSTSLDQYAATIASWFGVNDSALPAVFPTLVNFPAGKLRFV